MRKTVGLVLPLLFTAMAFVACDNQKTMQEYIREEQKAIERYIERQNIVVLKDYPKDSIFGEKEYYRTSAGLYMHVVDRGNTSRRAVAGKGEVQVRFDYFYYIKTYISGDTTKIEPYFGYFPMSFTYGISGSYGKYDTDLSCDGWAIPLTYVGEGAIVDLIVPSSLGNSSDNSSFAPVFYKNLHYTKFY